MAVSESEFNQLKDKVEMLIQALINKDRLCSLALQNGWDSYKISQILGIMDSFLKRKQLDYTYRDIDICFKNIQIDYQAVKSILIALYNKHAFSSVIRQYLITNFDANKNIAIEFHDIFAALVGNPNI